MTTFQFLFLRALVSFSFNLILINKDLKMVVWDTIGKENRCNLISKVFQGLISTQLSFSAVKFFPLAYCTAIRSISPLFVLIFSAMCLAEVPTLKQTFVLILVVSFVLGFIFTGK